MRRTMTVTLNAFLLAFALMSLIHPGVSFRQAPSNRDSDDEELGKLDYVRFRKVVRDRYILGRVLQAAAEIDGIQEMNKFDRDTSDVKENFKKPAAAAADDSRPMMTSYLPRLLSKRSPDLRVNELTGAVGRWPKRKEARNMLDGQIEWLFSRVYPWRVSISSDGDDDNESYFGNHVDLIGSSIIG